MSYQYQQCKQPCLPPPVCGKGCAPQCKVCVPACPCDVPVCATPSVKVVGEACIPVSPPPCAPKCTGPAVDICVTPQGVCPCDCKCPDQLLKKIPHDEKASHNSSVLTSFLAFSDFFVHSVLGNVASKFPDVWASLNSSKFPDVQVSLNSPKFPNVQASLNSSKFPDIFELLSFQWLSLFLKLCKFPGFSVAVGRDAFGEGTRSDVRKRDFKEQNAQS
ncbi:hypothetical protein E2320_014035, partial [Naja naja]